VPSRGVSHEDDALLERFRREVQGDGDFYGPALSVTFPVANTSRDVVHGLNVIPDGYSIVFADAQIHAVPGKLWTTTLAFLQADANNAHAIIRFKALRQSAIPG
jgi:hypothetical protein